MLERPSKSIVFNQERGTVRGRVACARLLVLGLGVMTYKELSKEWKRQNNRDGQCDS
ncbi:hypothetical protein DOTSEDRAFT_45607 [Dothistroma septosporum NZE10]|uniref:Uncharacterized protein n=1 Tax=Dothistroma septosporum (strain NZE10 / CBS 128990) TaxID=675120 RepID=N1PL51_DOTSN|nr:hypothetical protein DOTSEDRAFT_45607 [Dothistroma septosporum NZE10]